MNFEARYIDAGRQGEAVNVVAIWCVLNGRLRRFSADNVKDALASGHRFYVRDVARVPVDVHVVGPPSAIHLHTDSIGDDRNKLTDLPDWDRA